MGKDPLLLEWPLLGRPHGLRRFSRHDPQPRHRREAPGCKVGCLGRRTGTHRIESTPKGENDGKEKHNTNTHEEGNQSTVNTSPSPTSTILETPRMRRDADRPKQNKLEKNT